MSELEEIIGKPRILHLFEGYGVEIEYMIVDKDTLNVLPLSDKVIQSVTGKWIGDAFFDSIGWSNEIVLHVMELKTNGPTDSLEKLPALFQQNVKNLNDILGQWNAMLMPTGMHPWMDPFKETLLWPHDNNEIYAAYNRIFDCRGHGWANLQSIHLNLPFYDDEEFAKLHTAIRLLLPILPGIAASSPIADSKITGYKDYRLEVYRHNQQKVPLVAGDVIPEFADSKDEYIERILSPMYRQISPLDPEEILQEEWLNSRGAIARFERNTIEIRVIDAQECPMADVAISALVSESCKLLIQEKWSDFKQQRTLETKDLASIFLKAIKDGESAVIDNPEYLKVYGVESKKVTIAELWEKVSADALQNSLFKPVIDTILQKGTLATRILKACDSKTDKHRLSHVYKKLSHCLAENKLFEP